MGIVDFKYLKERVGIDDVAYSLGYRIDRSAGVGKYVEMVLSDGRNNCMDRIIISHPGDKGKQHYFHRASGGGGSVVDFIKENLGQFLTGRGTQWQKIYEVLCKFANEPVTECSVEVYKNKYGFNDSQKNFDASRFSVEPAGKDMYHLMTFLEGRKISLDTACVFSPFIHCVRDKQRDMKYPNLGFPYQRPGEDRVLGYEIRGYGSFKSKAPGTDSSTASWIVDLTPDGNPMGVENVYLAESAYDIMAFYQFNKCELHPEKSVFVSIGGTFSNGQIEGLRDYYRSAKFYDCFDNDLPGRIYGIRLAGLMSGSDFHVNKINMGVCIEFGNRKFILPNEKVRLSELGKKIRLSSRLGEWKAPPEFCDWNDVIMNRPMKEQEKMTKFQRDENLRQKRNPGLKI